MTDQPQPTASCAQIRRSLIQVLTDLRAGDLPADAWTRLFRAVESEVKKERANA